jgi:zinc protease
MKKLTFILAILVFGSISVGRAQTDQKNADQQYNKYVHEVLPNGLDLIISYNADSRVFAINILGKNRAADEPAGKDGITDFVNRMLTLGADGMNAEQIQNKLDDIGATITANDNPYIPYDDRYTSKGFSFIKFETIDEYAKQGTDLLYSIVAKPTFPEDEIAKTQKKVMGLIGMSSASTYQACRDLLYENLFADHPFEKKIMGSPATVASFTRADLINYHKLFYAPNNMIMAVASNIDPDTIKSWIMATFGSMRKNNAKYAVVKPPAEIRGVKEVHREMDKEQIYIYMGMLVPGLKSPDAPAINLASAIISSRLAQQLREKQGLAYSVGMGVDFMPDFGWVVASMGTGYQNYDTAATGMISLINGMVTNQPSVDELTKAQNSLWGSMLLARASRINQAYYMCKNEFMGVGYDYENDYINKIRQVKPADIKRVVRSYFDVYDIIIATVGKKTGK